jgi:serine/threonine-protein kinase
LLLRIVVIAVAMFLVGYLTSSLWMWAGAGRRTVVTVPNLRELTLEDATRELDRYDLLLEVADSLPNPEVAAGEILTQSPLPGQEVAPGIAIQVIVSAGRERHAVPHVSSLSREQAEQLLIATGLQPRVEEVTDSRRAGRVIGTIPSAGTVLAVPAGIRLLVSSGPPLVAVPAVVGLQEIELLSVLGAAGLRLGSVTRELRITEWEGEVVAQRPLAEDSIPAGSPVDVIVATQRPELLPPLDFR